MDTLALVWHYFWQMACGTLFFVLVSLLAVGLNVFVTVLEGWHQPGYIIISIQCIEIALFVVDLVVFGFFITIEAHKMIQEIRESRSR